MNSELVFVALEIWDSKFIKLQVLYCYVRLCRVRPDRTYAEHKHAREHQSNFFIEIQKTDIELKDYRIKEF